MDQAIDFDNRTGRVTLEFERPGANEKYTLLPPTLGSLRLLYEEADRIDADLTAKAQAAEDAADAERAALAEEGVETPPGEDDTPTLTMLKMMGAGWVASGGGMESYFAWWRKCFELCEADGKTLPADEDCPVWLASVSLHVRVLTHWLQFPTLAPGTSARSLGVATAAANGGA